MKFHLPLPGLTRMPGTPEWSHDMDAAQFKQVASAIDELGYYMVTVPEHLAMPTFELQRLGPWWMDALSTMAFLAATTSNVRIDASVLVLPYHHPLALAKALSTIDVLSGGRVSVCIGVGHAVREFEVLGIPFEERGARTDEILEAMHALWTQDEPEFHGRFYDIDGLAFEPRPVQQPGPPIHVGGNSKAALRRAARHDGWISNPSRGIVLSDVPATLEFIRAQPSFAGKEDTFEVSWLRFPLDATELRFGASTPAQRGAFGEFVAEQVAILRDHGITRTGLPVAHTSSAEEFVDYLRWFAEEVRPTVSG